MRQFFMGCLILGLVACSNDSTGGANTESTANNQCTGIVSAQASNPAQVELTSIVERVVRPDNKRIVIGSRVPASIAVGNWTEGEIDYGSFLTILWNNRLTAVEGDALISVIRASEARKHALPGIDGDRDLPAAQWVSRILVLENLNAAHVLPSFRPMLPQEGHLAAITERNALLIVGPFAKVNRVVQLLKTLDQGTD